MSKSIQFDKYTLQEHSIKTNDGKHTLYVQEWGNKQGTPIIFLHGGPGSGCSQKDKQIFDPVKHYVIFIDQRGSGFSIPYASTEANTTSLLIEDIEQIRQELSLDSFVLFGRSWGATLALCYAIEHPQHVKQIVTGGIFLANQAAHDWIAKGEYKIFYPEVWEKYGSNPEGILKYAQLSLPTIKLDERYEEIEEEDFDEDFLKVNVFYDNNHWFLPENHILNNASKLTMPITIIQGRYDMMTPPIWVYKLHTALPNSTIQWTLAGHTKSDRGNFDATKAALSQI